MPYLDPGTPDPFEIIVGTYEQYLLGYRVQSVVNVSELSSRNARAVIGCIGYTRCFFCDSSLILV